MGWAPPGLTAAVSSASCSIKAEKRVCKPTVPFTEATLPASVVTSYTGPCWADEVCVTRKLRSEAVAAPTRRFGCESVFFILFLLSKMETCTELLYKYKRNCGISGHQKDKQKGFEIGRASC